MAGLEDTDFDMLAGDEGADESPAEEISELDTGSELADEPVSEASEAADAEAEADQGAGAAEAGEPGANESSADAGAQAQEGGQQVPLAVLLEERKSFQSRLDEMNQKLGRYDALQERIDAALEAKNKPESEPEPEYLDDPKAYVDHKTEEAKRAAQETSENVTQLREMTEAQANIQQVVNRLQTSDTEFIKAGNEDLYDAIEHVREMNIQNALDMGATEEQAKTEAAKAMFMTQAQVLARGKNPSEFIYNMAKRMGYQKAEAAPTNKPTENKDDVIIAGQEAQGMGGGAAPDDMSNDEGELTDEEFAEIMTEEFGADFVR